MDQESIEWTAYLTDDVWYLPEPDPVGYKAEDQPFDFNPWPTLKQQMTCAQHPDGGVNCCWRRCLNEPFMGFDERIATLGHFGVGFPDGYQPVTVPGSFTLTNYEIGDSSILDNNILDRELSFGGNDATAPNQSIESAPRCEDDTPSDPPQVWGELPELEEEPYKEPFESTSSGEETISTPVAEHTSVPDQESNAEVALYEPETVCAAAAAPAQCPTSRDSFDEHAALAFLAKSVRSASEEREAWVPEAPTPAANPPRKYRRKRLTHNLSAEFVNHDECDSDSDYTPDTKAKKRARATSAAVDHMPTTKTRVSKMQKVWHAIKVPRGPPNRRKPTAQQTAALHMTVETAHTITEYASTADKAHFAAKAKQASFALKAMFICPQADFQYGDIDVSREAFSRLNEAFDEKQKSAARNSYGRNVQEVVLADQAVEAIFARYAQSAEVIL
ncbi:hypothetical protein NLG97_g7292 [Lecanicillium saksenae]|uniref:Uncharacterized protein n=1 Tax=Lecanicillium saksenae TaxID=468837 RepID=A0ACC1QMC1_9HYPO|nr:hypothetical protein NLG97_g7292 [Lecanicillium saksenae]